MSSADLFLCVTCKEHKEKAMFSKDKSKKNGVSSTCRICSALRSSKWRKENREQFLQNIRDWYERNKEKVQIANRKWAKENKELMKAYNKKWAAKNKEYITDIVHRRRARIKGTGGSLSKGFIKSLYKLQRGKCACCGVDLNGKYHMDHIMPLALGGSHIDSNIQLLAPACNLKKNRKHPIDYMQSKGYLL